MVINDTVFCSVAPVTFSVTAVLGDGSLINGSESDFTLMGESKWIVFVHFFMFIIHVYIRPIKALFLPSFMAYH